MVKIILSFLLIGLGNQIQASELNFPFTSKKTLCSSILTASRVYSNNVASHVAMINQNLKFAIQQLDRQLDGSTLLESYVPVYTFYRGQGTIEGNRDVSARMRAVYHALYEQSPGIAIKIKGRTAIHSFLNDLGIAYGELQKVNRLVGRNYLKKVELGLHTANIGAMMGLTVMDPQSMKFIAPAQMVAFAVMRGDLVMRGAWKDWVPAALLHIKDMREFIDGPREKSEFIYWGENYVLPQVYLMNRLNPQSFLVPSRREQSRQLYGWFVATDGLTEAETARATVQQGNEFFRPNWIGVDFHLFINEESLPELNLVIEMAQTKPQDRLFQQGEYTFQPR
jgi:hypothetical protein